MDGSGSSSGALGYIGALHRRCRAVYRATFTCVHFCSHPLGDQPIHYPKVPDQLTASAQTLYDSLALGAFMGISMTIAGSLYEHISGQVFWVMALISLLQALCLGAMLI